MKTILKSIRLKQTTIDLVEKQGEKENRNFSNMLETILINHFKK